MSSSTKKIESSLHPLDWQQVLERLQSFATSERARTRLWQLAPLKSESAAEEHMNEIRQAGFILQTGERPFMESLDLFSIWNDRLKKNAVLKPLELRDVRKFCHEVLALETVLQKMKNAYPSSEWFTQTLARVIDASPMLSAIDHLMSPSGEIRTDASEKLYRLTSEKTQQARAIQQLLDKLIKQHDMEPILQDRYVTNREGRWVLPVRSGQQHAFKGIIHAASQSKQTVFMEPEETIPINNRLAQLEIDIEAEIEYLLTELSHYLATHANSFDNSAYALEQVDTRLAQAQLASQMSATLCRFEKQSFKLRGLRHPLLALGQTPVVANDVELDEHRRILLLSGPNAGGKTVLLKSIGLACQMARCGLLICADEGSYLPFFSALHVAVGDAQSVDAHLSTFAAHLKILNDATQVDGPGHLLLIDEIAGSTDPEEGAALARSFIEAYAQAQVFAIITSHLGPLKMGWDSGSGVVNGSLEYDARSGRPTYQFLMGIPGQSLALQTAKRVGVSESILTRAFDLLSPESKAHQRALAQVEEMKEDISKLRESLGESLRQARHQKSQYKALIEQFRRERDQWMEKALRKAEKKIDEVLEKSKVDNIFRKHEAMSQIRSQFPEVVTQKPAGNQLAATTAEEFAKIHPPGSSVFIPSVGQDGVVQGQPNSKGELPVLSNSMRLFVHWSELRPSRQSSNPTAQILRRASIHVALVDSDRTVDLRGQKVEEALENLEVQLDTASLAREDRLKVIHGHGTEALKRAVRTYLSRSPYVKKWKAGSPDTGGDGVTWVELSRDE